MDERRVHGREDRQPFGLREEAAGPGRRLEAGALKVRLAAIAPPAPDRQVKVHPGGVGELRDAPCLPNFRTSVRELLVADHPMRFIPNSPSLRALRLNVETRLRSFGVAVVIGRGL